ncbi:MAG TPA: hypothetical protein VM943_12815, partial [Pyrinomonadaceae bacterium]|nr:hypothetical protein [Pyrinomonadaceae bacterium]
AQLARGQRLTEVLKQPQYQPMEVEKQVLIIWAATNGHLDNIPIEQVRRFETEFLRFVENAHPGVLQNLREKKSITDEIKNDLAQVVADFKENWNDAAAPQAIVPVAGSNGTGSTPAAQTTEAATVGV